MKRHEKNLSILSVLIGTFLIPFGAFYATSWIQYFLVEGLAALFILYFSFKLLPLTHLEEYTLTKEFCENDVYNWALSNDMKKGVFIAKREIDEDTSKYYILICNYKINSVHEKQKLFKREVSLWFKEEENINRSLIIREYLIRETTLFNGKKKLPSFFINKKSYKQNDIFYL